MYLLTTKHSCNHFYAFIRLRYLMHLNLPIPTSSQTLSRMLRLATRIAPRATTAFAPAFRTMATSRFTPAVREFTLTTPGTPDTPHMLRHNRPRRHTLYLNHIANDRGTRHIDGAAFTGTVCTGAACHGSLFHLLHSLLTSLLLTPLLSA